MLVGFFHVAVRLQKKTEDKLHCIIAIQAIIYITFANDLLAKAGVGVYYQRTWIEKKKYVVVIFIIYYM